MQPRRGGGPAVPHAQGGSRPAGRTLTDEIEDLRRRLADAEDCITELLIDRDQLRYAVRQLIVALGDARGDIRRLQARLFKQPGL